MNVILIFPEERPVFLRETNNNMYSVSSYFFSKVLSELPTSILGPVLYAVLVYFVMGLNTVNGNSFVIFTLSCIAIYNATGAFALVIGTLFADKQLAVTLTPLLIMPLMLVAGFFVNQD